MQSLSVPVTLLLFDVLIKQFNALRKLDVNTYVYYLYLCINEYLFIIAKVARELVFSNSLTFEAAFSVCVIVNEKSLHFSEINHLRVPANYK